jgi:cyclohexanone monooxygenase
VRGKIREIVKDPKVAEQLTPRGYPFGSKRACVDSGFYDTFNKDHVSLVDLRATPITEITAAGVSTSEGDHAVDVIIFATGFDAMTGALLKMDIRGKGGVALREAWEHGPKTYLGLQVAGFPNLFTVTGPGSPSVLTNMMTSIEQHVDWINAAIGHVLATNHVTIEATETAQEAWVKHVNDTADTTLFPQANSWYIGANVPGKPRVFMPYIGGDYKVRCDEVVAKGYEGFAIAG